MDASLPRSIDDCGACDIRDEFVQFRRGSSGVGGVSCLHYSIESIRL